MTACFEPPTTPLGFNELSIAGALRKRPVELCLPDGPWNGIYNAEYVIEGEIVPGSICGGGSEQYTGYAMPEFSGYNGKASHECWLLKVKAVTHTQASYHATCIGPSEEHIADMAGIPTEAEHFCRTSSTRHCPARC